MKRFPVTILLLLSSILAGLSVWWSSGLPGDFWAWRSQLVLLTGIDLIVLMSAAMVLGVRPARLESALGGLDKMYGLHRRLGIATGLMLAAHWLIKLSPSLVVALDLATRPLRGARHGRSFLTGLAKDMGEWAAWVVLAMVIVALLRMVPYRFWRKLHKLFAPLYLMGAFHSAVLMPAAFWLQPAGVLTGAALLAGSVCALSSMGGRVGRPRRHAGHVLGVRTLPGRQLEVICKMGPDWPGHVAGQFALVTFHDKEGAHPYTIASAHRPDGALRFIIKALGDYTASLPATLAAGMPVMVEGPYGCFDMARGGRRQAWVAGGIGVTPFLAWLQSAGQAGRQYDVDFYVCVQRVAEAARLEEVERACRAHGIRLHVIESAGGARLEAAMLPEVDDVWFCGPPALGQALRQDLARRGAGAPQFHQEAFSMR